MSLQAVEHELEMTTRAILAAEDWSPQYAHSPEQHAELVKTAAALEVDLMRYFRALKKRVPQLVNWWYYKAQSVQAYNIQVMINEDEISKADKDFIKVVFDPLAKLQSLGVDAASQQYGQPINLPSSGSIIQDLTTEQVGGLVGKTVNDEGKLVDNPNPEFKVDDTTRDLINNAIKKSINLGYSQDRAAEEVGNYIANPSRASMIARTEAVRAYNIGSNEWAKQSGYKGKFWTTAGAIDYCQDNAAQGVIPLNDAFSSGAMFAPAHPNCRCYTAYVQSLK